MRKRVFLLLSASVMVQPIHIAIAEPAPPYLSLALKPTSEGAIYKYDLEYRDLDEKFVARIDPSKKQGERVALISSSQDVMGDDFVEALIDLEKNPVDEFWCSNLSDIVPLNAALMAETDAQVTYKFKPLPDLEDPDDIKLMEHLEGHITVSKQDPQVLSMSLIAPRPFKPVWIAKISQFELSIDCDRVPDGRTHMSELRISIVGKAAMQTFHQRERKTLFNITAVDNRNE